MGSWRTCWAFGVGLGGVRDSDGSRSASSVGLREARLARETLSASSTACRNSLFPSWLLEDERRRRFDLLGLISLSSTLSGDSRAWLGSAASFSTKADDLSPCR